jgi:hypothetical protein
VPADACPDASTEAQRSGGALTLRDRTAGLQLLRRLVMTQVHTFTYVTRYLLVPLTCTNKRELGIMEIQRVVMAR